MLSDQQVAILTSTKILFGHQSVGNNIIHGIRDLTTKDARLRFNIVKSSHPQSIAGPALVEFNVGENGNPQSKIDSFLAVLDEGMGLQGGIAMFKFCYVDIGPSTEVDKVALAYSEAMTAISKKYPLLKIVHITMPLTSEEPAPKAWIKRLLGKATREELNLKRNQFNDILRQRYGGAEPIFDLAEVESTYADGSRSFFIRGGKPIYTLAPEYTADGGHLNEVGRRLAAERLLLVLSQIETKYPPKAAPATE